ncbi:MAG: sigma 54-interacting transcriptional regulator, partial [Deltaproteobacteria bacterium]|nr:sigma 54-interacting transcriptional regulator [Deltaproteobacteria bacterium]
PKAMQVKLLRVLESGAFERVGGERTVAVDVRVISATNRDLKREVEKGNFRQDLYYRLNVVPLHLPPLRERRDDIPLLVEHFLSLAAKRGQQTARFASEALALMRQYGWPGNVRELQNVVHYALARCDQELISPTDLPPELHQVPSKPGPVLKLEAQTVQAALTQCGGNKAKAARLLGVGRATLYRFLKGH